jgi:hypothetical protein
MEGIAMATSEERMKILKMVQEGKITADDAAQLIEMLEEKSGSRQPPTPEPPVSSTGKSSRWFRVRITDTNTGRTRVNVRLPVSLINAGIKMGARFSPEVEGLDMDQLIQFINSGETGQMVDVINDDDGEHVEVFIE